MYKLLYLRLYLLPRFLIYCGLSILKGILFFVNTKSYDILMSANSLSVSEALYKIHNIYIYYEQKKRVNF